jgi:general secretion pathway protein C
MNKAPSFAHSAYPGEAVATRSAGRKPWPAAVAGLLWLAAGLSAGYWVLLAWGRSPVTPVPATLSGPPVVDTAQVARALGALPTALPQADAPAPAASRYALQGVVAVGTDRGAALIAVDAQPSRPFRVGAEVESGVFLQAVTAQEVRLGASVEGPASVTLAMPAQPGPQP